MRLIQLFTIIAGGQAMSSYPYQRVSPLKSAAVTSINGNPEHEPLETGTMKTLPNLHDLKKNLLRDGFKEAKSDTDSVEERIKWASRNFGGEEKVKTAEKNGREQAALGYGIKRGWEIGVKWNPKKFGAY